MHNTLWVTRRAKKNPERGVHKKIKGGRQQCEADCKQSLVTDTEFHISVLEPHGETVTDTPSILIKR